MFFGLSQVSDRAYRIGQERSVTVYRLVAEGTIEEKILRLHDIKRSLADALLEGADMSSRLSKDALLACCLRRRMYSNILLHTVILLLRLSIKRTFVVGLGSITKASMRKSGVTRISDSEIDSPFGLCQRNVRFLRVK